MPMNGTSYPLNLSEKCWALELRTPEAIQELVETFECLKSMVGQLQTDKKKLEKQVAEQDATIECMDKWQVSAMKDIKKYKQEDRKKASAIAEGCMKVVELEMEHKEELIAVDKWRADANETIIKLTEQLEKYEKTHIKLGKGGGGGKGKTAVKHKAMFDRIKELEKQNAELKDTIEKLKAEHKKERAELISKFAEEEERRRVLVIMSYKEDIKKVKDRCEMLEEMNRSLTQERDYEHTRFLQEQIKRSEAEELNKKIEEVVRGVGHSDTINACLPIWYGQDEDEE